MPLIFGQSHAIQLLTTAMRREHLHHAWIFHGPFGVGKFTAAIEFAKLLLDPEATPSQIDTFQPDATHRAVELINASAHPDLHIIRKELATYSGNDQLRNRKQRNIPIDLLRELMIGGHTGDDRRHEASVAKTPVRGHSKVFIIDEAELLDIYGQNALLKTLEEPPANTYIFLITTQPSRLLPTIRSRCQRVSFGLLDAEAMDTWFEHAALEIESAQREWVTAYAAGSPGVAKLAVEMGFAEWHRTLAPMLAELDRGDYPVGLGETVAGLVNEYAETVVKAAPNASKDAANKAGAGHMFNLLAFHVRRRLLQLVADEDDPQVACDVADLIHDAERQLQSNVNLKLLFANLIVQWADVSQQYSQQR